jgi:ABC-type bacteriocin/lantibiotic exporter with double-glycine peptidase domain
MPFVRRTALVRQHGATDCGAACLAMVLGHFGKRVAVAEVSERLDGGRDGTSALSVLRVARMFGLAAEGVAATVADLRSIPAPAILHWDRTHFVVLDRWRGDHAIILDPLTGRQRIDAAEVARLSGGVAIVFAGKRETSAEEPQTRRPESRDALVRAMLRPAFTLVAWSVLCLVVAVAVLHLATPAIGRQTARAAWQIQASVGVLLVATVVVRAFMERRVVASATRRAVVRLITRWLFATPGFVASRSRRELGSRVSEATEVVADAVVLAAAALDASLAAALVGGTVAFGFNLAPLAALLLGFQAALCLLALRLKARMLSLTDHPAHRPRATAAVVNVWPIRLAGAEGSIIAEVASAIDASFARTASLGRLVGVALWLSVLIESGAPAVLLGIALISGMLPQAGWDMLIVIATSQAALALLSRFRSAAMRSPGLMGQLDCLRDIYQARVEPIDARVRSAQLLDGGFGFDRVSFQYASASTPVLEDVTFDVRAGEFMAIVGDSGSGKSTLVLLLLGIQQATAGCIRYGGTDLREIDLRTLRRQVGVVTRDAHLIDGNIADNIRLGRPDIDLVAIEHAGDVAGIAADIRRMPLGYRTPLSQSGSGLSGGQRERILLARALARRPRVVILDEAFTCLGASAEQRILGNVTALGCTTVVLTSRQPPQGVDRVLYLEGGRITAGGGASRGDRARRAGSVGG